jgi:hypothetical protein
VVKEQAEDGVKKPRKVRVTKGAMLEYLIGKFGLSENVLKAEVETHLGL